jgi:hypothetical protein
MSGVGNRPEKGEGARPRLAQILPGGYVYRGLKRDPEIAARVRAKDREIRREMIETRAPSSEPTS